MKIQLYDIIRDQMQYTEDRLEENRHQAEASFLAFLNSQSLSAWTHEHFDYRTILLVLYQDLKSRFRSAFHENGLAEMPDREFESYVREKAKATLDRNITFVDELWPVDTKVSRVALREWYQKNFYPETLDLLANVIRRARAISIEYREKTRILIEEYEKKQGQPFPKEAMDI